MNVYLSKYRKNKVKQMLCEGFGLDDIAAKTGLEIKSIQKVLIKPLKTKKYELHNLEIPRRCHR